MSCPYPDRARRAESRRLLAALEIPDCSCELLLSCPCGESCTGAAAAACACCRGECSHPPLLRQPPCRHRWARANQSLDVAEWAELQHSLCPDDYHDDPPPPPAAPPVLRRAAVVAVYAARRRKRVSLYHRSDLWRKSALDDGVRVGPLATHAANGATVEGDVAVAGRVGPHDEAPALADELRAAMGPLSRRLFDLARKAVAV